MVLKLSLRENKIVVLADSQHLLYSSIIYESRDLPVESNVTLRGPIVFQ